jgi:hypothetical protein
MSVIVLVPGIAQQLGGEHTLLQQWRPALRDGLARAGHTGADPSASLAFYGDLFHRSGTLGTSRGDHDALPLADPSEQELLLLWWQAAAWADSSVIPPTTPAIARTPQLVHQALGALTRARFFAGMNQPLIALLVKEVHLYFVDDRLRNAARERVAAQISHDTRIVIGHSLGSVVSYEALCQHPEWPVHTFITLGSPLGIRNVIFDRLQPAPRNGSGIWPPGVKRWTNVAGCGDVVALAKKLSIRFGERVHDEEVDNEPTAHNVEPYLKAVQTGRAIARALADF